MLALGSLTLAVGAVAAVALWVDKRRAHRGQWRISERTLHTIELCGGWLGSLAARRVLRHKTRKPSYRLVAGGITLLHVAIWIGLVAWSLRVPG